MTYTPQNLGDLVPPVETLATPGSSPYRICVENHNELYTLAETQVAAWQGEPFASPTGTEQTVLRFLSRGGHDALSGGLGIQLRVEVIARSTTAGAGGDVKLYGGTSTVSAAVSGASFAVYTVTATPAASDEEWTLSLSPGAGKVLELCSMVAYWVAAAPGVRAYPSEWRQTLAANRLTSATINTEVAGRLLAGPVRIARDRPACVFSHLYPYDVSGATFAKAGAWAAWGTVNNTEPVIAARGRIPSSDVQPRPYVVDYYLRSSGSITGGSIRVGATEFPVLADNWGSFQVELGPADVDITAKIDACGVGDWAYFEAIQVWRTAP
jgi:hypothetical protein